MTKRRLLALCVAALMLLSGCSSLFGEQAEAQEIKDVYQNMTGCSIIGEIKTIASGETVEMSLGYVKNQAEEYISVLKPDIISGLHIPMENGTVAVLESGTALEGALSESAMTPVELIPSVVKELSGGLPVDVSKEKRDGETYTGVTYEQETEDGMVTIHLLLDREKLHPINAVVYIDSIQVMECTFTQFDVS